MKKSKKNSAKKKNKVVSDATLSKYWRLTVLSVWGNKCVICGNVNTDHLDCHHIIHRNHFVTRWDWRNGVPVCRTQHNLNSHLKMSCHTFADTLAGKYFLEKRGVDFEYLSELSIIYKKDFLLMHEISENTFRKNVLEELKRVIDAKIKNY